MSLAWYVEAAMAEEFLTHQITEEAAAHCPAYKYKYNINIKLFSSVTDRTSHNRSTVRAPYQVII
jgi:hypothetical protein